MAYDAERGNGLKVSIVPVLHLGSSVLVLLALALEHLRGQLDSLEYHGNGNLRIEADQCTLGNRCHNTLDMGFFTTISGVISVQQDGTDDTFLFAAWAFLRVFVDSIT